MLKPPRHILCLVVDGLRASALGAYGAALCETPALNRLAAEGIVFDFAIADLPTPVGATTCFWQGLGGLHASMPEGANPSIAETVSSAGYSTHLITDSPEIAEHPLAGEFDDRELVDLDRPKKPVDEIESTQLAQFFGAAIESLNEMDGDEPSFVWLHTRSLVDCWDAPLELRGSLADEEDPPPPAGVTPSCVRLDNDFDPDEALGEAWCYTGQVMVLDACIAALFSALDELGWLDNTLIVLASSRGYPLGEHGRLGYADSSLYEELVHVPLVMRLPEQERGLSRSQSLAAHCDLHATLVDFARTGSEPSTTIGHGLSLRPATLTNAPLRDHVCLSSRDGWAIRTPAWHCWQPIAGVAELFVKPDDRWEANEISSRCEPVLKGLQAALAAEQDRGPGQPAPLDSSLIDPNQ